MSSSSPTRGRSSRRLAALVLTIATVAAACGDGDGNGGGSSVAASVGEAEYSLTDLAADLADDTSPSSVVAKDAATAQWLSDWVIFTAIELEMIERGIVPTEAQITIARERLESNPAYTVDDPRNSELLRRLQLGVAAVEWSEAEVPDPPPDTASDVPGILCSSHILVETEAEATDVLGRLDAGEEFGALAIELSIDPGSGQFGGGLGCLLQGSLVPEFEAAAYAASPGDVVGPVQSQFGFHVIEVLSVGPPTAEFHPQMSVVELAQLQGQASSAISPVQAEVDAARAALLRDIQDTALTTYGPLVVIDPAFGVWDESSFQVVPPAPVGSGSGDDGG